jgi:hypothetical protein
MHKNIDRRYKHLQDLCGLLDKTCISTNLVFESIISLGIQERKILGDTSSEDDRKGGRYPLCIACINWTRRLSKTNGSRKQYIPFDNVLLFIQNPGIFKEPDKRSLFRILQNISIIYAIQIDEDNTNKVEICNLYTRLCNFSTQFIVNTFRNKYFATYVVDISNKMIRTAMKDKIVNERMPNEYTGRARQRMLMEKNSLIMNDIIRLFWEYNGTPEILINRTTAKYVRKMIRTERLQMHDMDATTNIDFDDGE